MSVLGSPSLDEIVEDETVVEHVNLQSILSDFLAPKEVQNLNSRKKMFNRFHATLISMALEITCDLIQNYRDHESQASIIMKHRTQILLLALIHPMDVPSIIWLLEVNHIASCRHLK